MKFLTAALLASLAALPVASANEYEVYEVNCKLTATEQDFESPVIRLERDLKFTLKAGKLVGTGEVIPQSRVLRILDVRGQRMAVPKATVSAQSSLKNSYGSEVCNQKSPSVTVAIDPVEPALVQQYLQEMGAANLPDVSRATSLVDGKVVFNQVSIGYVEACKGDYLAPSTGGTLAQIHYDYNQFKGLSYHLRLEACSLKYISPKDVQSRRKGS